VGLGKFAGAVDEALARVTAGGAVFKALRGEWGSGETFAARGSPSGPAAPASPFRIEISETEAPVPSARSSTAGSKSSSRMSWLRAASTSETAPPSSQP
jgi:hypothetical protein